MPQDTQVGQRITEERDRGAYAEQRAADCRPGQVGRVAAGLGGRPGLFELLVGDNGWQGGSGGRVEDDAKGPVDDCDDQDH